MNEEARGKAIRMVTPLEFPPAEELIADNVDLLTQILVRLPLKSIDRFKCVSKHWLSLLTSITGAHLYKQLWKACAGPLVDVPRIGERVFYFPQGHIEQLEASTNVELNERTPLFDLPSKILCRVSDIKLRAEQDSDEVYAQITLVPEQDQNEPTRPDSFFPEPLTPVAKSFCKVLTASDASSHGGFTVCRRHAEQCLPLDLNQHMPTQELRAKDIHDTEWRFKYVFRGQPKRHLLTTGWATFVTSKGLVAGDSVVFLMGEKGEIRVGVRRSTHLQVSTSSLVGSSQSMHLGVHLATASCAMATGIPFVVFNKPRMSQFIVGMNKYLEAINNRFAAGMRFEMIFEGADSSLIRHTGTIVGVEDLSSQWENSKWRSLKVEWDEAASIARPNRVSPWEIKQLVPNE